MLLLVDIYMYIINAVCIKNIQQPIKFKTTSYKIYPKFLKQAMMHCVFGNYNWFS